jgi:hypothetical protein
VGLCPTDKSQKCRVGIAHLLLSDTDSADYAEKIIYETAVALLKLYKFTLVFYFFHFPDNITDVTT